MPQPSPAAQMYFTAVTKSRVALRLLDGSFYRPDRRKRSISGGRDRSIDCKHLSRLPHRATTTAAFLANLLDALMSSAGSKQRRRVSDRHKLDYFHLNGVVPSRNIVPNKCVGPKHLSDLSHHSCDTHHPNSDNPDIPFSRGSLAEVIDRDEHEGGLHLNLQRPLRTVRATSSVRRSENCFDAIFANGGSRATAFRCWTRP